MRASCTPVWRRWAPRFGVLGLLAAPLALTLLSASAARAGQAVEDDACSEGADVILYVDDEPAPRCTALLGDADARAHNELWRSDRIMAVESGARTLDVMHTDAQLRRPEVRALSGMVISEIYRAEVSEEPCESDAMDEADAGASDAGLLDTSADAGAEADGEIAMERVARVTLSEPWAELCGKDTLLLRVDDALGARGRVLHIDGRGVLAYLGGRLVWLSRSGLTAPVFRTTWRSDFSVVTDAVTKAKPKPRKRKPKRRSSRRRR